MVYGRGEISSEHKDIKHSTTKLNVEPVITTGCLGRGMFNTISLLAFIQYGTKLLTLPEMNICLLVAAFLFDIL